MAKFEQVIEGDDHRYSEWIQPKMALDAPAYKLACCDCGLVHDVEFRVVRVTQELGHGYRETEPVDDERLIVHFRARRNKRATGQIRRHRHK